jgi:hypothetical protein
VWSLLFHETRETLPARRRCAAPGRPPAALSPPLLKSPLPPPPPCALLGATGGIGCGLHRFLPFHRRRRKGATARGGAPWWQFVRGRRWVSDLGPYGPRRARVSAPDPPCGCGVFLGFSRVLRWPRAAAPGMPVVLIFFVGGGWPDWAVRGDLLISCPAPTTSWGA